MSSLETQDRHYLVFLLPTLPADSPWVPTDPHCLCWHGAWPRLPGPARSVICGAACLWSGVTGLRGKEVSLSLRVLPARVASHPWAT